ncbi:TetR family transcriptional regulator C-terminal domain-containing protein [Saccharopolyspora sp. NFXS83]|uniref:TetR family transcriptional regulator C-terminal domain-containing protein n=1 Tax=Saccharopolyspora sp. NFXS83 TaxID=2993560 RepID=UPI00224A7980|nr:TetR family transcriptional regulator C-terminal domain-containing protein [Saccharopolyspora sp. NFXS83]MCX2733101.1 TetR family transcriptional regulator C-terminal domain-containing protein [Saccharopolyspora sp. NFXS83]
MTSESTPADHDADSGPAALRARVREVVAGYPHSHRAFADRIGLDATKLSKSLTGVRRFTPVELTRIAEIGQVTVNWLINGRDDAETVAAAPRRAARPPERTGGDRYQQILDAAWELIAERGFHAVRVADIAEACGVSAAAIHYHFPGRDDLLTEALRHSVRQAFDRQVAELHSIDDAHQRLLRLVELQLPESPGLRREWSIWLQVWNESALRPELRGLHGDSYTRWHDTIERTIRQGQHQGVFTEGDAEELAVRLTALIDGLGIGVLTGRPERSVQRMRQVLHDFIGRDVVGENASGTSPHAPDDHWS